MTASDYIQQNYEYLKKEMYNITNGENDNLFEDFFHDCLQIFLEHPKSDSAVASNSAKYFLVRIGLNQWRSKTSRFHYKYRRQLIELNDSIDLVAEDYDVTQDVLMEVAMIALDRMYKLDERSRYKAMIIIIYHSLGSNFSEVERQYEIPRTTVRELYVAGKEQLQQIINDVFKDLDNGHINLSTSISEVDADWSNLFDSDSKQAVPMAARLFQAKYFNA